MIPWWATLVLMATTGFFSGVFTYILKPRKVKGVDRTVALKEVRSLNVFDAYSDAEMKTLRKEAAERVKTHRKYGHSSSVLEEKVKELRKIDDEIQARENAKIAIEQAALSQTAREMAMFDTVFDNLDKKEIK